MSIDAIIAAALLDRLERLSHSAAYRRLEVAVLQRMGQGPEAWLAHWRPAVGLGGRPIAIADEPGGVDMLAEHLGRITYDCA
jgi:uncharacterized protein (DUF2384 family)